MKVGAIIQARMNSSRLPGKVLLDLNGKSVLERVVDRVSCSKMIDEIVVATSSSLNDTKISKFCKSRKISYIKGSEDDVLSRFYNAAKLFKITNIIRITADCPMIDYTIIDKAIKIFASKEFDYVSNCHIRKVPVGLDIQVFPTKILERIEKIAKEQVYREHVSNYIYEKSNYRLGVFNSNLIKNDFSNLRITLDTIGDYNLIRKLIKETYGNSNSHIPSYEIVKFYAMNIKYKDLLKTKNKIKYEDL